MCHIIKSASNKKYYYHEGIIYGFKEFNIVKNKIKSIAIENYEYKFNKYGTVTKKGEKEQSVIFLPLFLYYEDFSTRNLPIYSKINAGFHTLPLYLADNSFAYTIALIKFKEKDILFYDGNNISVNIFAICEVDEVKDLFTFLGSTLHIESAKDIIIKNQKKLWRIINANLQSKSKWFFSCFFLLCS